MNFIYLQARIREVCSRVRPSRRCSTKYHPVALVYQRPKTLAWSLTLSALVHCRFYGTWSFGVETLGCYLCAEGWRFQDLFWKEDLWDACTARTQISHVPVRVSSSSILQLLNSLKKRALHSVVPLPPADRAFPIYRFRVRWFSWWLQLWDIPRQLLHQNPDRKQQLGISGKILFYLGAVAYSWGNRYRKHPPALQKLSWERSCVAETVFGSNSMQWKRVTKDPVSLLYVVWDFWVDKV